MPLNALQSEGCGQKAESEPGTHTGSASGGERRGSGRGGGIAGAAVSTGGVGLGDGDDGSSVSGESGRSYGDRGV